MLHFRKQGAFTLIELLIVVAIIAILAAIAVPNFLEAQTRAKVSRAKSDMRTLATALESYYVDNNNYVPSSTVSDTDGANSAFLNTPTSVDPLVEDIVNQWITNNTVIKYPGVWKTYHLKSNCLLSGISNPGESEVREAFQTGGSASLVNSALWMGNDGIALGGAGYFTLLSTPISYISDPSLSDPWINNDAGGAAYMKYVACNKFMPVGFSGGDGKSTETSGTVSSGMTLEGIQDGSPLIPAATGAGSDNEDFDAREDSQILWWALYTVGPDKTDSIIVNGSSGDERQDMIDMWSSSADASGPSVAEMVGAHVYDPTNGTKSSGEIWRIGGGRPSTELPMENYDGDKLEDDDAYSATGLIHQHLSQMVK